MASAAKLSPTLSLYIVRRFLLSFGAVLLVFAAVIFLLDVIELMRRTSGRGDISVSLIAEMALLKLPYMAQKIVPFAALFGGMHTFWRLTRFHELIVARAAGVSVWQFLFPAIASMVLLGIINISAFNPIASAMLARYDLLESRYVLGRSSLLTVSHTGLWLRQADEQGQSVIHAASVSQPDMVLRDVIIFLYEGTDQFIGRIDASEASLGNGTWNLKNVLITGPNRPSETFDTYSIKTNWTMEKIQDSFAAPETMSFWELPGFISLLDHAGFSASRHRLYWHSLLAVPLLLSSMVLVAASFSLRPARRGGIAVLIGSGVIFGFLLFFLSDVVMALGLSATIPAVLAAWTPAGISLLIGLAVLLHLEDG
jgi:lipopolysaccharide export system permease protein